MFPLKIILHPTDFSPRAEHAFRLACSLARDHAARVIVLHVAVPPIVGYGEGLTPPPDGDWQALKRQLWEIKAPDPRVPIEHRLVEGHPVTEILHVARETSCDLIVMGTHGRTALGRLLMGSVADHIVRKAICPVLTVKTPLPEGTDD